MDNLLTPSKYEPAPIANSSTQKGGRGKNHKRNCKCPLCKKKGGSYIEEDIETGTLSKEEGKTEDKNVKNDFIFAEDDDYDDLDAAEKGQAGPFKVGGTRKRKYKKSKKCRKSRKTRRRKHKTHRRR